MVSGEGVREESRRKGGLERKEGCQTVSVDE